ncbi:hypothetical protein BpHYR1_039290 [Brachionus plicatilis]|uniref:Uncharacterized protein n=1 Tax=Brachionus plicatilis TaxID=10195 RepID=A0A3M7PTX0_BRAPC|nr:hypothetical protein BpHYR1_039290 [Brachionus plicatilis]
MTIFQQNTLGSIARTNAIIEIKKLTEEIENSEQYKLFVLCAVLKFIKILVTYFLGHQTVTSAGHQLSKVMLVNHYFKGKF